MCVCIYTYIYIYIYIMLISSYMCKLQAKTFYKIFGHAHICNNKVLRSKLDSVAMKLFWQHFKFQNKIVIF